MPRLRVPWLKKGNLENISQPQPTASASLIFSSYYPFLNLSNLRKTQIRVSTHIMFYKERRKF